ncbi:MAG: ferritin-like domain-containing protein [Bryobacteraceae bacterium]
MANHKVLDEAIAEAPNRRAFITKLAMAGAAVTAAGAGARIANAQSATITDADILNFALNLEYLEAEFYTVATTGKTIEQMGIKIDGSGTAGATTGGQLVNLDNATLFTKDIANQIAADERAHVTLIRGALSAAGAQPVAKPAINLGALGFGFGTTTEFLQLARAFEDIGVTAYAGAAPLISSKDVLGYAARIAEVEAEHSANIRLQVAKLGISTSLLDGADVLPPPSGTRFFPVDSNGLTQTRTPGQVLFIAYGFKANAKSGGFFPTGFNGVLNTSSDGVSTANITNASVNPTTTTTNQSMITLDASGSTSASGKLTYLFMVKPGGKVPAILQTSDNPKATIQFVNGPGAYPLQLTVTDGTGKTSSVDVMLVYQP